VHDDARFQTSPGRLWFGNQILKRKWLLVALLSKALISLLTNCKLDMTRPLSPRVEACVSMDALRTPPWNEGQAPNRYGVPPRYCMKYTVRWRRAREGGVVDSESTTVDALHELRGVNNERLIQSILASSLRRGRGQTMTVPEPLDPMSAVSIGAAGRPS
jgi:hypothetical protein